MLRGAVTACRWRVSAALVVLLAAATACGGSSAPSSADDPAAADDPRAGIDPVAAIEDFDGSSAADWSRASLNTAVLVDPSGSRDAALERLDTEDPDTRIAAVYALSITLTTDDGDALAPLLESESAAERVLAAAGMVGIGDPRAVPVLVEALSVDDLLPFGAPPLRVWEQARWSLLTFTGQDFGLAHATTAEMASATTAEWEAWWAEAEGSFEVVRAPGRFGP